MRYGYSQPPPGTMGRETGEKGRKAGKNGPQSRLKTKT